MKFSFRKLIVPASMLLATIVGIALWETNTFSHLGKAGIVISVFFAPGFLYRAFLLYQKREQLKELTEMTTMQMTAIKSLHKKKKKNKSGGKR